MCSENKGADLLCTYCTVDHCLCFLHMEIVGYLVWRLNFIFEFAMFACLLIRRWWLC